MNIVDNQKIVKFEDVRIKLDDIKSYYIENKKICMVKVYESSANESFFTKLRNANEPYIWKGLKKEVTKREYESFVGPNRQIVEALKYIKTSSGEIKQLKKDIFSYDRMNWDDIIFEDRKCLYVETNGNTYTFTDGCVAFDIYKKAQEIDDLFAEQNAVEEQLRYELYTKRDTPRERLRYDEQEIDELYTEQNAAEERFKYDSEPQMIEKEQRNGNNFGERGEQEVEYALKWLPRDKYILIQRKSIGKYGQECIILHNEEYIEEKQEYDHIVIGHQGVFLIETKNYNGEILIDKEGNWIRKKDGTKFGERNPIQQVRRHEKLLKSIIGDVFIYSIICLAHPKVIVEGSENSSVKVIKSDLLCDFIEQYEVSRTLTLEEMKEIESKIYSCMLKEEVPIGEC